MLWCGWVVAAEEGKARVPGYTLTTALTDLVNSLTQTFGLWYL